MSFWDDLLASFGKFLNPVAVTPSPVIPIPIPITPTPVIPAQDLGRLVAATYMIGLTTYDTTVLEYQREMEEAKKLNIGAFSISSGIWNGNDGGFKVYIDRMFQAAQATNFKCFLSPDLQALLPEEILDMVKTFWNHPAYLKINGKPVVSSHRGEHYPASFWTNFRSQCQAAGQYITLVPGFLSFKTNGEEYDYNNPDIADLQRDWVSWQNYNLDGLAYWASVGTTNKLVASQKAFAALARQNNKLNFAGFSPYFALMRSVAGTPRRVYDRNGFEGMQAQWDVIIADNPSVVIINCWNDWSEAYLSPAKISDTLAFKLNWYGMATSLLKSHQAMAEFCGVYAGWYLSGTKNIDKDRLFVMYRTHPKNLTVLEEQPILLHGEILDDIYICTMLKSPATLLVSTGGVVSSYQLPQGISHARVPFQTGAQNFQLLRSAINLDGDPIDSQITKMNYTNTTVYGEG